MDRGALPASPSAPFSALFNGVLAVGLRLPAIIVTLGTYSMFQGLSLVVNRGRAVVPPRPGVELLQRRSRPSSSASSRWRRWSSWRSPSSCTSSSTARKFGYRVQAVGSNPEAAELAGISNCDGPAADAGPDGRDLRPLRGDVYRLPRRHRPERGLRLRARRGRRGDHRRHAALRRLRHGDRRRGRHADHPGHLAAA